MAITEVVIPHIKQDPETVTHFTTGPKIYI